jgi:hypothetical protein
MQEATENEVQPLLRLVSMAIEILETMEDSVVSLKAAKLLRDALCRAEKLQEEARQTTDTVGILVAHASESILPFNHYWGPLNLIGGDIDVSFPFQLGDLDMPMFSGIDGAAIL